MGELSTVSVVLHCSGDGLLAVLLTSLLVRGRREVGGRVGGGV